MAKILASSSLLITLFFSLSKKVLTSSSLVPHQFQLSLSLGPHADEAFLMQRKLSNQTFQAFYKRYNSAISTAKIRNSTYFNISFRCPRGASLLHDCKPIQFQGFKDCGILQFENIIPGQLKRLVGACSTLVSDGGLLSLDMLTILGQVPFPFHCFTFRLHKHI